jgi:hypothetical protein
MLDFILEPLPAARITISVSFIIREILDNIFKQG